MDFCGYMQRIRVKSLGASALRMATFEKDGSLRRVLGVPSQFRPAYACALGSRGVRRVRVI